MCQDIQRLQVRIAWIAVQRLWCRHWCMVSCICFPWMNLYRVVAKINNIYNIHNTLILFLLLVFYCDKWNCGWRELKGERWKVKTENGKVKAENYGSRLASVVKAAGKRTKAKLAWAFTASGSRLKALKAERCCLPSVTAWQLPSKGVEQFLGESGKWFEINV